MIAGIVRVDGCAIRRGDAGPVPGEIKAVTYECPIRVANTRHAVQCVVIEICNAAGVRNSVALTGCGVGVGHHISVGIVDFGDPVSIVIFVSSGLAVPVSAGSNETARVVDHDFDARVRERLLYETIHLVILADRLVPESVGRGNHVAICVVFVSGNRATR